MLNSVVVSGSLVGTRELITEFGADWEELAGQAGLSARLFNEPDIFVRAAQVVDFLELAARACRRPDFGLLQARRLPLAVLGQGWMIMRSAATIGEALMNFVNLYGLYTDAGSLRAEPSRDGLRFEYSFLPVGQFGVTQIILLTLGCICLFVGESLRREWQPRQVMLRYAPADPRPFVEFFGAGTRFDAGRDAVLIDHDTLAEPMGHGAARRQIHRAMLTRAAAGKAPAAVAQAKALLSMLLRHERCSLETLADALGTSPRTLQRRLEEGGTHYRTLVDEVRADMAWRHVKRSDLSFALVADLLGYDSQAAFSRAFRRWHAVTPRVARGAQE